MKQLTIGQVKGLEGKFMKDLYPVLNIRHGNKGYNIQLHLSYTMRYTWDENCLDIDLTPDELIEYLSDDLNIILNKDNEKVGTISRIVLKHKVKHFVVVSK